MALFRDGLSMHAEGTSRRERTRVVIERVATPLNHGNPSHSDQGSAAQFGF